MHKNIAPIFIFVILLFGCTSDNHFKINGNIDYVGSSEIFLSQQPLHYKYAPENRVLISPDSKGNFEATIDIDSTQIIQLNIDDASYPIVAQAGSTLSIEIPRSHFPDSIFIGGYPKNWNQNYINYRKSINPLKKEIEQQLPAFRKGESTAILSPFKKRYLSAEQHLGDTPLDNIYFEAVGEYLVKRLEAITYNRTQKEFNADKQRQQVLSDAKELNFFSFELLHAQRAGIRDFTNAYANTFGVADSLEQRYGQELMQYDVKRLGYQTLDSARTSVLKHIDTRKAKAYAKMYLIAERIGEMSAGIAQPSYEKYVKNYSDFPAYTSFLTTFYNQIKDVSPGQPAIPFSIPNKNGETVQLKDFEGKYVLLDFWASWCIPCLDEFPHMKKLYNKYSREEFDIVAISIEEDSLRWRRALQRFDNPWPQLYGGNGFQQETFRSYRGGGIPFYILIDPNGNILRYNDVRPSFNLPEVLDSLITNS